MLDMKSLQQKAMGKMNELGKIFDFLGLECQSIRGKKSEGILDEKGRKMPWTEMFNK